MSSQVPPPDHKFSESKGPTTGRVTAVDGKPSGKIPVVQRPDADEGVIAWGYLAAVAVLFVCIIVFASTCKGDDGQVTREAENPLENANASPDLTSGFDLDSASPATDPTVASSAAPVDGGTTVEGSATSAASTTVAVDPAKAIEDAEISINSKLKASPIQFEQAKADIPSASSELLKEIAASIKELEVTVVVEGHTDVTGNAAANIEISEDRAKAVVARLIELDAVAEADVSAVGKGSDEAQYDKDAAKEDLEKDRKVEIELKAK